MVREFDHRVNGKELQVPVDQIRYFRKK